MRKKLVTTRHDTPASDANWLDLEDLAEIELTSEHSLYPVESALLACEGQGWRAAEPGTQTIRLIFREPVKIQRIRLVFTEFDDDRTQEYVLKWSQGPDLPFREIVRQQWNFSPEGANTEIEQHDVDLSGVAILELIVTPDINDDNAFATLKRMQVA